jgi:hypothetical protein
VSERQHVEQGGCDCETREADKYDGNHGVPHKDGIAPQGFADMFVSGHGLTLREQIAGQLIVLSMNHRPHNLCVKKRVK